MGWRLLIVHGEHTEFLSELFRRVQRRKYQNCYPKKLSFFCCDTPGTVKVKSYEISFQRNMHYCVKYCRGPFFLKHIWSCLVCGEKITGSTVCCFLWLVSECSSRRMRRGVGKSRKRARDSRHEHSLTQLGHGPVQTIITIFLHCHRY